MCKPRHHATAETSLTHSGAHALRTVASGDRMSCTMPPHLRLMRGDHRKGASKPLRATLWIGSGVTPC